MIGQVIGTKIYFCRILRSKVVMVRVGGGWIELSSFLRTHMAAQSTSELPPPPLDEEVRNLSMAFARPRLSSSSITPTGSPAKSTGSSPGRSFVPFIEDRWQ
jgi:hypothetical protein